MRETQFDEAALRRVLGGRRVVVTGHTGFKGGWLSLWLWRLGAQVVGVALPPPRDEMPALFDALLLAELVDHRCSELRDPHDFALTVADVDAELVIHMAAQPLVRASYDEPADTFLVNAVGTARVLDAARAMPSLRGVLVITSDKCYHNREWLWGYREGDRLGGADPYSASKACAELVTDSYRHSFFADPDGPALASARAGNVIGGGDWARDRLVPDLIRAALGGRAAAIRNPGSIRPWQHVLDPLAGYLQLAAMLVSEGTAWNGGWNFGPDPDQAITVADLAGEICRAWGRGLDIEPDRAAKALHEARSLRLDCSKAKSLLGWAPRLGAREACELTVEWHRAAAAGADMRALSLRQIEHYVSARRDQPAAPITETEAA